MNQHVVQRRDDDPRIGHSEAMQITAVENRSSPNSSAASTPTTGPSRPTARCWDVRALAAHVVGSAAAQASPREFVRQVRKGRPIVAEIGAEYWWDGMNELQVRERRTLTPTS